MVDRNESLYRLYLDEIQALNEFVLKYQVEHKFAGLQSIQSSDDPDVTRLLESLAFFSARTHDLVFKSAQTYWRRLYQQLFPYLLTPVPASGILKGQISGLLTEPIVLDRGTEFLLRTDQKREFSFQTRISLALFPVNLYSVKVTPAEVGGIRLRMEFKNRHPMQVAPSPLSILIDYIGDTLASFSVLGYFKRHLQGTRLRYGPEHLIDGKDTAVWRDLDLPQYGAKTASVDENEFLHPLEVERLFFQDPRLELFLHLELPQPEKQFSEFALEFTLSETWPRGLVASKDIFQLHCVPVINLNRIPARPIILDGTLSRYPILCGSDNPGYEFVKSLGVYRLDDNGMTPLASGVHARHNTYYEIEAHSEEHHGQWFSHILFHYPQAFADPVVIHVDAIWHQPSYRDHCERECQLFPYALNLPSVRWEWALRPATEPLAEKPIADVDQLLQILQLSHKRYYDITDLKCIMELVGIGVNGRFKHFFNRLLNSRYELRTVHDSRQTAGCVIYFLDFNWDSLDRNSEFFRAFLRHLETVLNQWSSEREVRVALEDPDDDLV